jgi:hypothetical protein
LGVVQNVRKQRVKPLDFQAQVVWQDENRFFYPENTEKLINQSFQLIDQ